MTPMTFRQMALSSKRCRSHRPHPSQPRPSQHHPARPPLCPHVHQPQARLFIPLQHPPLCPRSTQQPCLPQWRRLLFLPICRPGCHLFTPKGQHRVQLPHQPAPTLRSADSSPATRDPKSLHFARSRAAASSPSQPTSRSLGARHQLLLGRRRTTESQRQRRKRMLRHRLHPRLLFQLDSRQRTTPPSPTFASSYAAMPSMWHRCALRDAP